MSLTLLSTHGTFFSLSGCLIQFLHEGLCLVLLHLVTLSLVKSLGSLLFSEGKWRNSGSGGEGR